MSSVVQSLESMHLENQKQHKFVARKMKEVSEDQKRVGFAVKAMTDALPPNIGVVVPSEDCKTEKSGKYRALMRALRLPEDNNVASLSVSVDSMLCDAKDFSFNWGDQPENASYEPFLRYLQKEFEFDAVDLSEGQGLADKLLYVSDIYTLRPRLNDLTSELKKAALEPQFRFRIRGRTDIAVFKVGGIMTCGDLEMAFEIKPKRKFSSPADINRALREGVLQLIGSNADNHYSSPLVIVTGLYDKHYLLYLELCLNAVEELRYYLRVKVCASLAKLIQFAQLVLWRGCVTTRFAAPPTPTCSPSSGSPVKADEEQSEAEDENEEDFDDANVSMEAIGEF